MLVGTKVRINSGIFLDSLIWLILAVKAHCALGEAEIKFLNTVSCINVVGPVAQSV